MSVTLLWKDLLVGLSTENDKGRERNYFFVFEPIENIHYYNTKLCLSLKSAYHSFKQLNSHGVSTGCIKKRNLGISQEIHFAILKHKIF
jgi:hypothetical protein